MKAGAERVGAPLIVVASRSPRHDEAVRIAEALLFAATTPLSAAEIGTRLPVSSDIDAVLDDLRRFYERRGVNLVRVAGKWAFRTASDLQHVLARDAPEVQRLSRAAMETLSIIAYHQPTTRAEIEEIRGVSLSKGTLDLLLETGWVRLRGRRRSPGRPVTYGTTPAFLEHFGLDTVADLPGLEELKGLGLFEGKLPPGLDLPMPSDDAALEEGEDPIEADLSLGPVVDSADRD